MSTELYLVRHGETPWNKEGRFQGCTDIQLSDDGIQQATYLKDSLNGNFDVVYSSPLIRAYKTAQIICEGTNILTPNIAPNIREVNFGQWEGLTLHQISDQYPTEFHSWRTDEDHGHLMGGDLTLKSASIRAKNTILEIVNKHIGQRIVIVAHGGILKAGIIGLFDWKMTMYHKFFLGNTSLSKITFNEMLSPILMCLNDTSHLPNE
jgi:probable phosphoglycerate mutase